MKVGFIISAALVNWDADVSALPPAPQTSPIHEFGTPGSLGGRPHDVYDNLCNRGDVTRE